MADEDHEARRWHNTTSSFPIHLFNFNLYSILRSLCLLWLGGLQSGSEGAPVVAREKVGGVGGGDGGGGGGCYWWWVVVNQL